MTLLWPNLKAVNISEEIIRDTNFLEKPTINICGTERELPPTNAHRRLLAAQQQRQHRTELKLQGKLACLSAADHSVSPCSVLKM